MTSSSLILCASENDLPDWVWIARYLDASRYRFVPVDLRHASWVERKVRTPAVGRYRVCVEAALRARAQRADLIITHLPLVACWTALATEATMGSAPILAGTFNFTTLPQGRRRRLMMHAFRAVDRFMVFSRFERELYARHFDLPVERFDMVHWGMQIEDELAVGPPLERGEYYCAVGGEGRDYGTLFEAARLLPQLKLVVVARPHNLVGLRVPDNVDVRVNIPPREARDIVRHAKLMVLPLAHAEVPCGHVTIVSSMLMQCPLIATRSAGVEDYVENERTGLACEPHEPQAMAASIARLWEDGGLRDRLKGAARAFAEQHCTERSIADYLQRYLEAKGL